MATDDANVEYFLLNVTGKIETADFPNFDYIWCKYCYYYGKDWNVSAGIEEGMTQTSVKSADDRGIHCLNFPLEISFKSSNVSGWPQLVVHAYGTDAFGNDVVRGYGSCHIPLQPGSHSRKIAMFTPEASSSVSKFFAWFFSKRPEFCDSRTVAMGEGRDVARVRTQGHVIVNFNVAMKNMGRLGYALPPSRTDIIGHYLSRTVPT